MHSIDASLPPRGSLAWEGTVCTAFLPNVGGESAMIGRTALVVVIYHADKLHQWAEMRREVAHQTNLFELSLGGRSPLREPLSRSQLSICIARSSEGMQPLMWNGLHAWLCKESRNGNSNSKKKIDSPHSLSLVKLRKWAQNFKSIYIHCLGSLRRWTAPKVAGEPSLTFDCTRWLSIHSSHLLSGTFPPTLYWALSLCLIDMLLQHCPGHICHLDSSRAAWHSPSLPTAGSEVRQNWKSLEVTSQVY